MIDPLTDKLLEEAVDRIARTADGSLLYLLLQRRLMRISSDVQKSSALRLDEGERRFAARLIDLMKVGIFESGRRNGNDDDPSGIRHGEQPIVVPAAEPRRVRGSSGAGRRINDDTVVPGWNDRQGDEA